MTQYTDSLNEHIDKLELELAQLHDVSDAMETDMGRLQSTVDKLPKMADGVHWIPWMEVYHPHEAGSQDDVSYDEDGRWTVWWWVMERGACVGRSYDISECYSTPEAAEAARDD